MKNKISAKIVSIIMAICMIFGTSVSSYAMENEVVSETSTVYATTSERTVRSSINYGEIPWAETTDICPGGFLVRNYTDITVKASTKENTNRMVVRPHLRMYSKDPNQATLFITITVIRGNGTPTTILTFGVNNSTQYISPQSAWFNVSPGETVTIRVDASTYYASESIGTYRYADVEAFEVYCD